MRLPAFRLSGDRNPMKKIELFATRNDGDKLIERQHPETIRKNAAKFWNQRHFSVQNLVSRMKIGEF